VRFDPPNRYIIAMFDLTENTTHFSDQNLVTESFYGIFGEQSQECFEMDNSWGQKWTWC